MHHGYGRLPTHPDSLDLPPDSALSDLATIRGRGRARATLALLGPAFVASVAYVDPGNFATNFQSGSQHGYLLVWVVVMASFMALLVQYLTSKLGLHTGHSLPELCREHFSPRWRSLLWAQAEIVAMATDLAEFTGAAVGINLVFGVPLLPAGVITGMVAMGVLALEQRGYRRFELAIVMLLAFVSFGFVVDFFQVGRQSYTGILSGLVPRLSGGNSLTLAIGIVGATVMPHVVYLHSSLQAHRVRPTDDGECRTLIGFDRADCALGMGLAGSVNVAMLCIAAALLHHPGLSQVYDLGPIHAEIGKLVGTGAALAFGIALMASGLSSSSVGTYAGQIVMAGFMDWKIPLAVRRLVTMVPSLLVLGFAVNATTALVYSQVVLSFGIPFALVPLALMTGNRKVMAHAVNRPTTNVVLWAIVTVIVVLNAVLLYQTLV